MDSVRQYNNYIKNTLVPRLAGQGKHVTTVDQYSNFLTADGKVDATLYANIAHPNQAGYNRMAQTWFRGIQAVVPAAKVVYFQDNAENSFRAPFPTIASGKVTLSCRACAAGETSAGSSVGLSPSQPHLFNRGGGWFSTAKGWEFWVGRVHSSDYPVLDGRKFGPYQLDKQPLLGAHDVPVELSMTVDLDHNKAWGQARWKDSQGRVQEFKAAPVDWDSEGGNVSNVMVTIDTRSEHTGIALDDLRVEGELPQPRPHPFGKAEHVDTPTQWRQAGRFVARRDAVDQQNVERRKRRRCPIWCTCPRKIGC